MKRSFTPLHRRLLEKTRSRVIPSDTGKTPPKPDRLEGLAATGQERFGPMLPTGELFIDFTP
jgi:hypothetical protein